jgi:purine-cytosine permease-like protein
MKQPPFTNLAVFVIFFGIALIEALQRGSWLEAALFLALGALSLRADFSSKQ